MRSLLVAFPAFILCGCAAQTGIPTQAASQAASDSFTAAYQCKNGKPVQAQYFPSDTATITIGERTIDMHIARSASGARYVGGDLAWRTKGSGPGSHGTLFTHDADSGVTGDRTTHCVQVTGRAQP